MKRLFKILAVLAAVVILGIAALIAVALYGNWYAERRTRAFCAATSIGSAISTAVARADNEKVPWASDRFYIFFERPSLTRQPVRFELITTER